MTCLVTCLLLLKAANDGDRVLVVVNQSSADSREIGAYYMAKRHIPRINLCTVNVPAVEEIGEVEYNRNIEVPVYQAIRAAGHPIDFIVTTKGIPIRVKEGKLSVDACLMQNGNSFLALKNFDSAELRRCTSPYFRREEHFSKTKFKFSLATQLDGYTVDDVKGLIDRSLAAKKSSGPFLFDLMGNLGLSDGWRPADDNIHAGGVDLRAQGFNAMIDSKPEFAGTRVPLMGYVSWGSNDHAFDPTKYLALRFQPGAIAETFVSTSARTFLPTSGGQSLIADLIAQGVTGVKGYVSEPYLFAMADPRVLFDRYTKGYNLAESYYMASPILKWKDVIIGDPLCAPYAK